MWIQPTLTRAAGSSTSDLNRIFLILATAAACQSKFNGIMHETVHIDGHRNALKDVDMPVYPFSWFLSVFITIKYGAFEKASPLSLVVHAYPRFIFARKHSLLCRSPFGLFLRSRLLGTFYKLERNLSSWVRTNSYSEAAWQSSVACKDSLQPVA